MKVSIGRNLFPHTNVKLLAYLIFVVGLLTACGGGDVKVQSTDVVSACPPFTDSFGRAVSCDVMKTLAGAELPNIDGAAGGGDGSGSAGGDGTAGDGAPISNAELEFVDANGVKLRTRTDANGYYRINLQGLKAPLVAYVIRNEKPWRSMMVSDIVRAPTNRSFYTINLTGLTDLVAYQTARASGLATADALTPSIVSAQKAAIPQIVATLNAQLATSLKEAGLDPATFNPLTTPFLTNKIGYDFILDSNPISRNPDGSTSLLNTRFSFLAGDKRVYAITPVTSAPYTNTRTILATQGTEVERLENAYSNGALSAVTLYDNQIRNVSSTSSNGTVCTYSPPLDSYISLRGAAAKMGETFAQTFTQVCSPPGGSPSTFSVTQTYSYTGIETVTTRAGTFANARVWTSTTQNSFNTSSTSKFIAWVDTVMNRPVLQKTFQVSNGVETLTTTDELIGFTIKNYPK